MRTEEAGWLSAAEIEKLYRSRALSPVEAVDSHLARIERLDKKVNSYITVTADRARVRAKEAEARYLKNAPLSSTDAS